MYIDNKYVSIESNIKLVDKVVEKLQSALDLLDTPAEQLMAENPEIEDIRYARSFAIGGSKAEIGAALMNLEYVRRDLELLANVEDNDLTTL